MSTSSTTFLEKYTTIIAEEVNVKKVELLPDDIQVTMTYVPLGNKLGSIYGKDTNSIITVAKQGQAMCHEDGTLTVSDGDRSWTLTADMYEIRYSGLQGDHQTVEGGVVISLDTTLTDGLKQEGVARELSRFLNQMRKDADLSIDQKIHLVYTTDTEELSKVIEQFCDLLCEEALLHTIEKNNDLVGDVFSEFHSDVGFGKFFIISR